MSEYPPLNDVDLDRLSILDRAWMNLNHLTVSPDTHLYFYAALDLRIFIEVLFFELISSIKDRELSARERSMYRAKDFSKLIEAMALPVEQASNLVFGSPITNAEVKELTTIYGKLGSLLHFPKEPYLSESQESWKESIESLIGTAYSYLSSLNERLARKPLTTRSRPTPQASPEPRP